MRTTPCVNRKSEDRLSPPKSRKEIATNDVERCNEIKIQREGVIGTVPTGERVKAGAARRMPMKAEAEEKSVAGSDKVTEGQRG